MIKNWLVRGDTHGQFTWMSNGCLDMYKPEETAIIILGDAGFNYYLNKYDDRLKKEVNDRGYRFYCVRGNHEARPQDIPTMIKQFDEKVHGVIYLEPEFPNIRYFLDYGFYDINNYTCYVIGGAYSVDKHWRLMRSGLTEETNIPTKSGWFANEQLTPEEKKRVEKQLHDFDTTGKIIDFMFTHTCPYSWEPRDLFLEAVDQSTVDDSMEKWLDNVKNIATGYVWCFGHFHADRIERPHIEQFYHNIEPLDDIYNRWVQYDDLGQLDWWLQKSPNFYMT